MAQQILEKLAKQREQSIRLISSLADEELDRAVVSEEGRWTIRETLTHLLNAEEDHCRVIAVSVRGDHDRLPAQFDLDAHNSQRLQARGHLSRDALLAALAAQRAKTEALFARIPAEQLDTPVHHPALGDTSVAKIFRIIGLHEKMHMKEIAAAL